MIDIGVNLLHEQFAGDREAVVRRAREAGVENMLVTCTNLATSAAAPDVCRPHGLVCTAGVHPHDAAQAPPALAEQLLILAREPLVRAVGETGLDFNRNFSPPDIQRRVFGQQIEVAASLGKPLFVHDRDSNGEVYAMLAAAQSSLPDVVIHCFTGSAGDLDNYLSAGFFIGVTGWVCDERRGGALRALVPRIPADRLLVETDAPFLRPRNAPHPTPQASTAARHKRRNEPALLGWVVGQIAELCRLEPDQVAASTAANARRLFQLGDPPGDLAGGKWPEQ